MASILDLMKGLNTSSEEKRTAADTFKAIVVLYLSTMPQRRSVLWWWVEWGLEAEWEIVEEDERLSLFQRLGIVGSGGECEFLQTHLVTSYVATRSPNQNRSRQSKQQRARR